MIEQEEEEAKLQLAGQLSCPYSAEWRIQPVTVFVVSQPGTLS